MKTASYISTQTAAGGVGKYPLSTQTLDFIQSQILLLEQLSLIGGKKFILKEPDGTNTGAVVIDGEVLILAEKPVMGSAIKYVSVVTEKQNIEADGETYIEARTIRKAYYSTTKTEESYGIELFSNFETNTTLAAQVKQMPNKILRYLSDILAEKLTSKEVVGLSQEQLDGVKEPCVFSCKNSIAQLGSHTNYNLVVRVVGDVVHQELTLQDNSKYLRKYIEGQWSEWSRVTENLHIEVKIVKGVVYLRHHDLPSDSSIVLLRKKKRSKYRSTGGDNASEKNRGKRISRSPKTQYVNFKGIELSQGVAGRWYVPKCVSVADKKSDGNLIGKELGTLCRSLIVETERNRVVNGVSTKIPVFNVKGLRNLVSNADGRNMQHRGYASIAIQIARQNNNTAKDAGGEMVKMKYRISRKRTREDGTSGALSDYIWYRSFSLE